MQVRFASLIAGLRALGDGVTVVTPCINPPASFHGAAVLPVWGAPLPFYKSPTLLLSPGISFRLVRAMLTRRPTLIHASSPGVLVYAAIAWAKVLDVPLVVSYHTHIPAYIPSYTWAGLVGPMWWLIRAAVGAADLTLVPSGVMKAELAAHGCKARGIEVWPQAVDTAAFSPAHRSQAWHDRLAGGGVDAGRAVVLAYVGRLGNGKILRGRDGERKEAGFRARTTTPFSSPFASLSLSSSEKNLFMLKDVLARLPPHARLAFVGDGPARADLEAHFAGTRTHFTGMLRGADLGAAYASADVFVMPSSTETLGFVALEAMASGLPAICAAAGGLVDIVTRPGEVGFLLPPTDVGAWAALAARLVASPDERARVGGAAREYVEGKGWAPAVAVVRDRQYRRAVRAHAARKGLRARARREAGRLVARALMVVAGLLALVWALFLRGGGAGGGAGFAVPPVAAPAPPAVARAGRDMMW